MLVKYKKGLRPNKHRIWIRLITFIVITSFLCQNIAWTSTELSQPNSSLQVNSAFDEDPRNSATLDEMEELYNGLADDSEDGGRLGDITREGPDKARAHRFRKDVRDAFARRLKRAKKKLGLTEENINRILLQGLARTEGGEIKFEPDQILSFAAGAVNEVLKQKGAETSSITVDDIKKVLSYHEKAHLSLDREEINKIRDNLMGTLDEKEYIQLLRYFENQYGYYGRNGKSILKQTKDEWEIIDSDGELEIVEELFCNFYMEQFIGDMADRKNELWLLDDEGNRIKLGSDIKDILEDIGKEFEILFEEAIWTGTYTDWRPIDNAIPDRIQPVPPLKPGEGLNTTEKLLRDMGRFKNYSSLKDDQKALLWRELKKGNIAAFRTIVDSNLRLVISIAKKYMHSEMKLHELVNEGTVGLTKAVRRFDSERGFTFATYATPWIRQGITRAIRDKSRTIRQPVHVQDFRMLMEKIAGGIGTSLSEVSPEDTDTITRLAEGLARYRAIRRLEKEGEELTEENIRAYTKAVDPNKIRKLLKEMPFLKEPLSLDENIREEDEGATLYSVTESEFARTRTEISELQETMGNLFFVLFHIFSYLLEKENNLRRKIMLYKDMNIYLLRSGLLPSAINQGLITISQLREFEAKTGFLLPRKALALIDVSKKIPPTLEDIANIYNITRERVRQIMANFKERPEFKFRGKHIYEIVQIMLALKEDRKLMIKPEDIALEKQKIKSDLAGLNADSYSAATVVDILSILDIVPPECADKCDGDLIDIDGERLIGSVVSEVIAGLMDIFGELIGKQPEEGKGKFQLECNIYLMKTGLISFAVRRGILSIDDLERLQDYTVFRLDKRFLNVLESCTRQKGTLHKPRVSLRDVARTFNIQKKHVREAVSNIGQKTIEIEDRCINEIVINKLIKGTIFSNLKIRIMYKGLYWDTLSEIGRGKRGKKLRPLKKSRKACHPEQSEGSCPTRTRFFATLRMTDDLLNLDFPNGLKMEIPDKLKKEASFRYRFQYFLDLWADDHDLILQDIETLTSPTQIQLFKTALAVKPKCRKIVLYTTKEDIDINEAISVLDLGIYESAIDGKLNRKDYAGRASLLTNALLEHVTRIFAKKFHRIRVITTKGNKEMWKPLETLVTIFITDCKLYLTDEDEFVEREIKRAGLDNLIETDNGRKFINLANEIEGITSVDLDALAKQILEDSA